MILVPLFKRITAGLMAAVIAASSLVVSSSADQPYEGYNYDWWNDPVPSQNGYVVDQVVSGIDLGIGGLNEPNDMFVDNETGDFYLVDTRNNRIVITEETFDPAKVKVMDTFTYADNYKDASKAGTTTTLNAPMGVYAIHHNDETLIYIADSSNDRVLACYADGTVWMEYTRPSSDVYEASVTYNPRKVIVDKALNVYVVIKSITQGAVVFSQDGTFNGYYGANRVEQTAEVIANAFWKLVLTREQVLKMKRNVSVEISNLDIDDDGFIYTVTELKSAETDVLKKLNPAGTNVFTNMGLDEITFGDVASYYWNGKTYASSIVDVDVDGDGKIHLLDFTTGRVFQYDEECDLLFIFGGKGSQKGLFTSPTAVETYDGKVYVLDGRKNSITSFKSTEFGEIVHTAIAYFNKGQYDEAKGPWEEVLRRDSNYWFAYIGLGNAYLNAGEYQTAMDYFYRNSRAGYNRAFKDFRIEFIRANFNVFMIIILVVVILLIGFHYFRKSRKKKKAAGGNKK